jgi:hypothetical protein
MNRSRIEQIQSETAAPNSVSVQQALLKVWNETHIENKEKVSALKKRIAKLEDLLFEKGAMEDAPCFCCGYNGQGYFDPKIHKCAERHHRLLKDGD